MGCKFIDFDRNVNEYISIYCILWFIIRILNVEFYDNCIIKNIQNDTHKLHVLKTPLQWIEVYKII